MANPMIRIYDCETQQTIDREMTDAEFAEFQAKTAEQLARIAERDSQ